EFFKELRRNSESPLGISQRHEYGVVGWPAGKDTIGGTEPPIQLFMSLLRTQAGIVSDVISMAHEGVHRAQCISLVGREDQEAVLKVLGSGARHSSTNGIGVSELAHWAPDRRWRCG